jgi:putative oxidoreductase
MFMFHGAQKLFGWHGGGMPSPAVGSQIWIGGVIELVGGALIAIGLFTRPAAFLTCGMMAVAYFQFHWKLVTANGMWIPAVNKGELAVLYCFVFLLISARGGGVASVDGLRRR